VTTAEGDGEPDEDGDTRGAGEGVAAAWTGVDGPTSRLATITTNIEANRQEAGPHHRMPA
jgi:hypothetical protein